MLGWVWYLALALYGFSKGAYCRLLALFLRRIVMGLTRAVHIMSTSASAITGYIQGVTQPTLTDIPPEILVKIFTIFLERVDVKTILLMREVCHQFRTVIDGSPRILKAFEIYKSIQGSHPNIGDLLKNIEKKYRMASLCSLQT